MNSPRRHGDTEKKNAKGNQSREVCHSEGRSALRNLLYPDLTFSASRNFRIPPCLRVSVVKP